MYLYDDIRLVYDQRMKALDVYKEKRILLQLFLIRDETVIFSYPFSLSIIKKIRRNSDIL